MIFLPLFINLFVWFIVASALIRGIRNAANQAAKKPNATFTGYAGNNNTYSRQASDARRTQARQANAGRKPMPRLQNANPAAPANAGGRGPLGPTTNGRNTTFGGWWQQPDRGNTAATIFESAFGRAVNESKKRKTGTVTRQFFDSGYDNYYTDKRQGQKFVTGGAGAEESDP